ncbi:uncharacterized protein LOC131143892 [Malania oleifera]|uniref:uncharacterized protein LOC131143892 n=1 Tax=Malania oleifera TaxID=397392 RepID=UPI0025AE9FC5|nr:uncharacterized protein LOC131143892 [Malania oleifera]
MPEKDFTCGWGLMRVVVRDDGGDEAVKKSSSQPAGAQRSGLCGQVVSTKPRLPEMMGGEGVQVFQSCWPLGGWKSLAAGGCCERHSQSCRGELARRNFLAAAGEAGAEWLEQRGFMAAVEAEPRGEIEGEEYRQDFSTFSSEVQSRIQSIKEKVTSLDQCLTRIEEDQENSFRGGDPMDINSTLHSEADSSEEEIEDEEEGYKEEEDQEEEKGQEEGQEEEGQEEEEE